jgi:hypothetical protein
MIALSIVTAVASTFLDNVTTVLLVVPVTISLCTVLGINTVSIFIAEIIPELYENRLSLDGGVDCDFYDLFAYLLCIVIYLLVVKKNDTARISTAGFKTEKWGMAFRRRFEYGIEYFTHHGLETDKAIAG